MKVKLHLFNLTFES